MEPAFYSLTICSYKKFQIAKFIFSGSSISSTCRFLLNVKREYALKNVEKSITDNEKIVKTICISYAYLSVSDASSQVGAFK